MNKEYLKIIAEETLSAIDAGKYKTPSGKIMQISNLVNDSVKRSKLYKPSDKAKLESNIQMTRKINIHPEISVTNESTLQAASRLREENPCVLNFASAKYPGGGFLYGASAQEESIARSSGLYPTLIQYPEYYEENKRSQKDNIGLYLDYAIYSPVVPVFRNDDGEWLEDPYLMSILTSPAPNRRAILEEGNQDIETIDNEIVDILDKRIYQILSIMADNGHSTIILGAWGCGVFGNDSLLVAELMKENLIKLPFFDRVEFPIYDQPDSDQFRSFIQIFGHKTD